MLDPFVTRPRHSGRRSALLLSIAAHAVLIYAFFTPRVGTTRHAAGDVLLERRPGIERIRYIEIAPARAAVTARARAKPRPIATAPAMPQLDAPSLGPISIATAAPIADIDLSSRVNDPDSAAMPIARLADVIKGVVGSPAVGAAHIGPYVKEEVEKVVAPFPNNPKPVYPGRLERQGVETSFVAQFVVDSTGKVDRESMLFPPNVHPLFIESVRESLRRARFYPAEVGGHRVRQLVEQQFTFVVIDSRDGRRSR